MDPQLSDFARDNLGRMIEQSKQATYLIRQMLDFSRRSVIEKSPMDLVAFVEEIIDLLEPTLSNNIELTLEIEPGHDSFPIDGDPAQLQRVVTNLAVNARDAMPDGGKLQFRLSCLALEPGEPAPRPEMAPGEWLTLSISDTGAGISSDVLPHIFEPFFTTKEVGQGTGLGLAQVYGIVKQHGGDIAVTSQEGQGTTFSLYLPA
jgi:signal transduction histidine kinase